MLDRRAIPAAAVYLGWAHGALGELQARFLPRLGAGVLRITSMARPDASVLIQTCAALESAVDAVDFQLVQARGLLSRMLRRTPDAAIVLFRRQLSEVTTHWGDVRAAAAVLEPASAAAELAGKQAFLEIGLIVKEVQPQFEQVAQWLDAARRQCAIDDVQLEQASFNFGHVQLAEARARLLLEELHRLDSTRTLLADMLSTELPRSLHVWEIRTGELLERRDRDTAIKQLLLDLTPRHIALRRLVHKVGATCSQLQHQEETVQGLAREVSRALSQHPRGTQRK